ncbi:hypothetical protein Glove_262g27 [Diversispora epigaea]|uniref:Uncharacterized protein n=1 Tax=Diversispora epigaea TaxID=1348612 RepID=A0A397IBD4_9GLOM|nr:hypothetical protein Glove_262g27 [Diversispora epigaea]
MYVFASLQPSDHLIITWLQFLKTTSNSSLELAIKWMPFLNHYDPYCDKRRYEIKHPIHERVNKYLLIPQYGSII